MRKWKFGGLSGDARESRVEVVEGGFPLQNCVRGFNMIKSEDFILKRKVGLVSAYF